MPTFCISNSSARLVGRTEENGCLAMRLLLLGSVNTVLAAGVDAAPTEDCFDAFGLGFGRGTTLAASGAGLGPAMTSENCLSRVAGSSVTCFACWASSKRVGLIILGLSRIWASSRGATLMVYCSSPSFAVAALSSRVTSGVTTRALRGSQNSYWLDNHPTVLCCSR